MATTSRFKEYIEQKAEEIVRATISERAKMKDFSEDFPLERIRNLSVEEYCLGTRKSKESLCYLLEFGEYKSIGFGIGGGTAKKYGVYYNKSEGCYKRGNEAIESIDELWPQFREQLYQFLLDSGEKNFPVILEDYPLLQGMAMVLTKLLCFYYPNKYITIGSHNVLKDLMAYFKYPYKEDMRCHQLNYYFNQNIRRDVPELEKVEGPVLGTLAWRFIDGEHKKASYKSEKGSGLGDEDVEEVRYWLYSPGHGASKWDEYSSSGIIGIGWGELGDLSEYDSRTDMQKQMQQVYDPENSYKMDSLCTWQFVNEMKIGDVVFAKKGMYKIVGRGIIISDYYYDDAADEYKSFRKVDWKNIGEWDHPGKAAMKTLTDITSYTEYVEKLESLFLDIEEEDVAEEEKTWPIYSKDRFLEEVFMDEQAYDTLVGLIKNKKNVILQGAPGVGKTYTANRLAYSIMGEKNKDRVMMVQFHQSYSYEDFIEGFRPSSDSNGFEIKKGSFYNFCKKAADDMDNEYFFIIDEINRGNLSKIFGELFMLIEKDKRGNALQLLYSDEKFYVPQNVYLIGMMNTADRGLALLDYALRRRFAFYDMKPAFNQKRFIEYRMKLDSSKFNSLIECVKSLNEKIKNDSSLGEGFCIGHSYFCDLTDVTDTALSNIVEYELIPLLSEYWFDEPSIVRDWSEKLRSAIK